ncbi:MAG TPA: primosomal protein N' [Nitrolancea sp.]|nr:primosomal protein N' [Nitrolancea sp.]
MSAPDETVEAGCFVDVAVDTTVSDRERLLTYALPPFLRGRIGAHQLVWVPLRRELKLAITVRIHQEPPGFGVRDVHAPVEPEFRFSPLQWELVEWLAERTLCSLFEAAGPFLPPGVGQRSVEYLRLREGVDLAGLQLTRQQRELAELLGERGELSVEAARKALGRALTSVIPKLDELGVIERTARVRNRPLRPSTVRVVRLLPADGAELERAPAQRRALELVRRRAALAGGGALAWSELVRRGGSATALRALAGRGLIEIAEVPADGVATAPAGDGEGRRVQLSAQQARVWGQLLQPLREERHQAFLLHGVTGSGKTEIYLRAAAWCLARGRQVIVLVPEISLATQVVERFTERFPGQVAVLHSALPDAERYQTWQAVAAGRVPVVVGPRSALFAPLERPGLIVLDEEHEAAYKQDQPPRYHARAVALELARRSRAVLLLGSATPDVTSYAAAERGELALLELPERAGPAVLGGSGREPARLELPAVEIVDMRLELQQGNTHIFSRALRQRLEQTLRSGEQAILFLNRRGTSTFVQCRACGHVESCPYCDIPLTYHADRAQLVCHRCNERRPPPGRCPACGSDAIGYYGTGTQRVERETRLLFPEARVLRWDQDALRRGVNHADLVRRVLRHEADIVVGTQMVAKGLDFPLVSTIGVINADTLLHLPDFRAAERTFQLLTQVAGRAGRRAGGGQVVVQSYTTDHYAIQTASRHDYAAFYREELAFRRRHGYPPFRRLVRLLYRHRDELTCQSAAEEVAAELAYTAYRLRLTDIDLLGPTPAFTARVRGAYQWQILLRGRDGPALAAAVPLSPGWQIDVDPMSLL